MLGLLALLAPASDKPPPVDVSAHLGVATTALWAGIILALLFFVVRPELWRRLWFQRIDPRPAGLLRIVFGVVVLWTIVDLLPIARFLFTDEGLWLPKMARRNYGGDFRLLWDPEHGVEHWYDWLLAVWYRFSLFHMRADPPFVFTIYAATIAALVLMIAGVKTRITTIVSWFLVNSIYVYSPIFYSGGDTVVRVFLFLGMLTNWGEAYSLDSWWRRRKAIRAGASQVPPLRPIAAWPLRLMMLQLAIIYCATGALKSGHTWLDGTALFFALNLDHFYRHPAQIHLVTFLQAIWVLPLATWITHIWEVAFPVAIIGASVRAYERERQDGSWPLAPRWRRALSYLVFTAVLGVAAFLVYLTALYFYDPANGPWRLAPRQLAVVASVATLAVPALLVAGYLALRRYRPRAHRLVLDWLLGKRLWLGIGVIMHVGIDVLMNVGTFVQVMLAVYIAWLSGAELDAAWRFLMSKPMPPEQRPRRARRWQALLLAPVDRLRHRIPRLPYTIHHNPAPDAVRRAALVRLWDLSDRVRFLADPSIPTHDLCVELPGGTGLRRGSEAGRALLPVLPGFWWMYPWCLLPGLSSLCGWRVARTFR